VVRYAHIAAALLFAATLLLAGHVFPLWSSYHEFEGRCLDCHLYVPKAGDTQLTFLKDITRQCTPCHGDLEEMSHPVDMKPSMDVPAEFPLDWKGEISCVSCHTVHSKAPGEAHLRSAVRSEGFCMLCHYNLEEKMHRPFGGSAHITLRAGSNYRYLAGDLEGTLDALSLRCLACHDSIFGPDADVEQRLGTGLFHASTQTALSHPIGVSYIEARRRHGNAYRSIKDLPAGIKLFAGMVGCGSCHNPYSKQHYDLVVSNRGSSLCLACHVK